MVRSTTSDVRIVQYLQQTVLDAKSYVGTQVCGAGTVNSVAVNMTLMGATMIRHNAIAAEMPDTGNAASYIAIELYDGTTAVTLKKVTGAAPSIYWDGSPIIDTGRMILTTRVSLLRVTFYNAGTSTVTAKFAFQAEKLA
jgi:hypothetical protein